jgi:hypothetical protein
LCTGPGGTTGMETFTPRAKPSIDDIVCLLGVSEVTPCTGKCQGQSSGAEDTKAVCFYILQCFHHGWRRHWLCQEKPLPSYILL